MKPLSLLLLAGLGLAQEPTTGVTKMKVSGSPSATTNPILWSNNAGTEIARVSYSKDILIGNVTDAPFAIQAAGLPHVITIVNRKGEPLVRCVAATQTCTFITPKENQ